MSIWAQQPHAVSPYPPEIQRKEDTKDRSRKAKESDLSTSLEGWMLQKSTYGYVKAGVYEDVHWGQVYTWGSEGWRGENSNTHLYGNSWTEYVSYIPWCAVRVHSSRPGIGMSWFTELKGIHNSADCWSRHERYWLRVSFCNHGSEEFQGGFYQLVSSVGFYFCFWGHYFLITVKVMICTWFEWDLWRSLLLGRVTQKEICLYG